MEVNDWLRKQASRSRLIRIFDEWNIITDPATGEPKSGMLDPDAKHFANKGGFLLGTEFNKLLDTFWPFLPETMFPGIDSVYDTVTRNLRGNLCPPISSGTAGGKANGITGNVMTGHKLQRSSGTGVITGVASIITDPVWGLLQQVDFTLPGGGGNEVFQFFPNTNPAAQVAAASWVQCGSFIRKAVGSGAMLQGHDLQLRNSVNTGFSSSAMRNYDLTQVMPDDAYEGQPVTEPFLVPASPSTWLPIQNIRLNGAQTGTLTIKLSPPWLMPIDDPLAGGDAGLWG